MLSLGSGAYAEDAAPSREGLTNSARPLTNRSGTMSDRSSLTPVIRQNPSLKPGSSQVFLELRCLLWLEELPEHLRRRRDREIRIHAQDLIP